MKCPACRRWIAPEYQPEEPTDEGGAEFFCVHCGETLYAHCRGYGYTGDEISVIREGKFYRG